MPTKDPHGVMGEARASQSQLASALETPEALCYSAGWNLISHSANFIDKNIVNVKSMSSFFFYCKILSIFDVSVITRDGDQTNEKSLEDLAEFSILSQHI